MKYVIGIDSGGTHYRVQACGLDGQSFGKYTGITANHYALREKDAAKRVQHHIAACLAEFGGKPGDCLYIVCGTTGLDSEEDDALLARIYTLPGFSCPVMRMNDAELAHYTVTGGKGVVVISGTGSIAFGRSRPGKIARVGGWPLAIMGEEGSGSWVSRQALRHLARYFDDIVPNTPLVEMVRQELGIATKKQLSDLSFGMEYGKQPALGKLVDKAAAQGDRWATEILQNAAAETMRLVREVIAVLQMGDDPDLPVGVWGSNIVDSDTHLKEFGRLLQREYPNAKLCLPERKTALDGAVRMALEHLGKTIILCKKD